MPTLSLQSPAVWPALDSRDQARWLPHPAQRDATGVRLYTRDGNDFTKRFPLVVTAVATLPVRSCLIDGEAIVSGDSGLAVFELIPHQRDGSQAALCAFDLLELDDEEVRRLPIEERKRMLAELLREPHPGVASNEYYVGDGDIVYRHACN